MGRNRRCSLLCHSRESGNPAGKERIGRQAWIPAFAGMTSLATPSGRAVHWRGGGAALRDAPGSVPGCTERARADACERRRDATKFFQAFPRISKLFQTFSKENPNFSKLFQRYSLAVSNEINGLAATPNDFCFLEASPFKFPLSQSRARRAQPSRKPAPMFGFDPKHDVRSNRFSRHCEQSEAIQT